MNRILIIISFLLLLGLSACDNNEQTEDQAVNEQPAAVSADAHKVTVINSMDASGYTYIEVSEDGRDYWIAVPQMTVNKGDVLYYEKGMEMKDFQSETLDRKFESVLFVDKVSSTPINKNVSPHPTLKTSKEDVAVKPLSGGKTVEQVYSDKDNLNDKIVKVRGQVTKFNPNIMGRNWVHIQDGTGSSNDYDLMVTSSEKVKVGEVIVVEGKVAVNQNFGAGYSYPVMIQDADIIVEKSL